MQKFHRSQKEPRWNTRAYRHPLEKEIDSVGWMRDASHAKVLVQKCRGKIACMSYWLRYARKWPEVYMQIRNVSYSKWQSLNGATAWAWATLKTILQIRGRKPKYDLLLWSMPKSHFREFENSCMLTTLCNGNYTCYEKLGVDFLILGERSKRSSKMKSSHSDYVMQGVIVWNLAALTEALLGKKRKRSERVLNSKWELQAMSSREFQRESFKFRCAWIWLADDSEAL